MTRFRRTALFMVGLIALLLCAPGVAVADPTGSPSPTSTSSSANPQAGTPTSDAPSPSVPPPTSATPGPDIPPAGKNTFQQIFGDCKEPPSVRTPLANSFADWPGVMPRYLPPKGDPFAADSDTTIWQQYGVGGLHWSTYDLGCAGNAADVQSKGLTSLANIVFLPAIGMVAATATVLFEAYHPEAWSRWLDVLTEVVNKTIFSEVWLALIAPMVLVIALTLAYQAKKGDLTWTTRTTGWALLMVVAAMGVTRYPLLVGHGYDYVISKATAVTNIPFTNSGTINQHLPYQSGNSGSGDDADGWSVSVANLHRAVLWSTWERGEIGIPSDGQTEKLAGRLYKDSSMTWEESSLKGDKFKEVTNAKRADYKAVAAYIHDHDPDAYDTLTGKSGWDRVWWAFFGDLLALIACTFMIFAGLIVLIALVSIRIAIMGAPILFLLGMHPRWEHHVVSVVGWFGSQLRNVVLYGIFSGLYVMFVGWALAPNVFLPPIVAILLIFVATIVAMRFLHPIRTVWQMFPGKQQSLKEYRKYAEDQRDKIHNSAGTGHYDKAKGHYDTTKGRINKATRLLWGAGVAGATGAHTPPPRKPPTGKRRTGSTASRPSTTVPGHATRAMPDSRVLDTSRPKGLPAGNGPGRPSKPRRSAPSGDGGGGTWQGWGDVPKPSRFRVVRPDGGSRSTDTDGGS
jgi:hypothetical protein